VPSVVFYNQVTARPVGDLATDCQLWRLANTFACSCRYQRVSFTWNPKTHVFGFAGVAPGRMSFWTPGRNCKRWEDPDRVGKFDELAKHAATGKTR
jgi:hypothetical protein